MLSTTGRRALLALMAALLLAGCAMTLADPHPHVAPPPTETDGAFVMPDGARLPYRQWLPADLPSDGSPWAVVLALHGMNDSRDAWEIPAPPLAAAGIAVVAPDQRGFGAAPGRGRWPGTERLAADARTMVGDLHARYPSARLVVLGESMGAAVMMRLAAEPGPKLPVAGWVLVAPAVWSRSEMNIAMRAALYVGDRLMPGFEIGGTLAPRVHASDNRAAIARLSTDPLTIKATRIDAINGLVNLMDAAQASSSGFRAPALFLYGGKDELVPKRATAATWRALPPGARTAFYPDGYHLLLRDHGRAVPIADIVAWIRDPAAPLPSGADVAAKGWLAKQAR